MSAAPEPAERAQGARPADRPVGTPTAGTSSGPVVAGTAGTSAGSAVAGPILPRPADRLGSPRLHLRLTDSTNLRARELAAAGAPHGTLVTADAQRAGRGRQGRAWSAPPGSSVLMSLILRGPGELLSLAAGVAVAETAAGFGASAVAIKWPNDVWVGGAKVAGILVEGRPQAGWAVLGIGLNASLRSEDLPEEIRGRATSLGLAPTARDDVLDRLLDRLAAWTVAPNAEVLDAVRRRDALRERSLTWAEGSGTGAGIDDQGRLLVDTAEGRVALDAGEVHLRLG